MSGTAFVKWRLPSSNAAEHHGSTDKAVILDHRASWHYERALQVRLTIDRNQSLHDCEVHFDVIQEFATGGHNDKDLLGRIRLNLAEYVDKSDDDEGIVRRYLMQDSKINSTLRIGIVMRQVEGDRNFTTYVRRDMWLSLVADPSQAAVTIGYGFWGHYWRCFLGTRGPR